MWLYRLCHISLWILILIDLSFGLRDVFVTIPPAVKKGSNANLICNYDLEGDSLYSVKWYKGRREFYRYTPKETPSMKIFSQIGINVERLNSNSSHVLLTDVSLNISGKFSCEVSADAPSFHTMIVSGEMEIIELPQQKPLISGIYSRYRLGDTLQGNCTSHLSKPAANLTWTINNVKAHSSLIRIFDPVKNIINNLETSVLEIHFIVTNHHFNNSHKRLKLKCSSNIYSVYSQENEKIIDEDKPKILPSGTSSHTMNLFQSQDGNDFNELSSNRYLTHYKDMASSSAFLLHNVSKEATIIFISLIIGFFMTNKTNNKIFS